MKGSGVVFVNLQDNVPKAMKLTALLVIASLIAVFSGSCRKIEQLPPEPKIEFQSFAVFDSNDILGNFYKAGRLKFHFQDGDGDLGLQVAEAGATDTTNLFFTLYRKVRNVMVQVPDNDLIRPSSYRIPYMERLGQNKILKGTIAVTFLYLNYDPADTDTLRYDFEIKDRAGNFSNIDSTAEIVLSVNGLYVKQ